MMILAYKAWLETRIRLLIGAVMIAGLIAFFVLANPWIIQHWKAEEAMQPERVFAAWSYRAQWDYGFFIWHFLHGYLLQQLFVLFAFLLGLGGLARERAQNVVAFTLALPVTRTRLFLATVLTGASEIILLAFLAGSVLCGLSPLIGKSYSIGQALGHSALLAVGGLFFYAAATLLSTIVTGEYAPALLGIAGTALMYFSLQPYVDGPTPPALLRALNLPGLIAGPPYISGLLGMPWFGISALLCSSIVMLASANGVSLRRDY